MSKVVIEIFEGAATITENEDNVEVIIKDYDVPNDMDGLHRDEQGDLYQLIELENE